MENAKFAVIKTGGKQYLVKEGDKIDIEKLPNAAGGEVKFEEVLLVNNGALKVGNPLVAEAAVVGKVLKQYRSAKQIVFKYKSKTRQHKLRSHRRHLTQVEITKISA